ncbi:sialidase family protein [Colwellia psychrerythraea]|uniref:Exo-alpha-sialidase n=1 Tax=Colwellia psychrerythraea TaxID=28229 RepID=A0A099KG24_COLPS|nr:sialidase family protein [Colwellia psychrerythraea]KGJ89714.1 hypothetical protein GAB14E_3875 [Colwellia psychrerythraea]
MILVKKNALLSYVAVCMVLAVIPEAFSGHHQHQPKAKTVGEINQIDCQQVDIRCAKTVTSAFSPKGDLWRLWSQQQALYYQRSTDNGANFTAAKRIAIPDEKISARNENRPKIAFDKAQGVYLSWAMPRERKYTADIRFSYSKDDGKTFSLPVTINDDDLLTGHSFNEMLVDEQGNVNIVWLDGRLKLAKQSKKSAAQGSAIFMATANMKKGGLTLNPEDNNQETFVNKEVVNGTCVCCRLAIDVNSKGNLAILWRHIYGDNIREFAITTVNEQQQAYQVSYDHWQINGCPHQGGALSIDDTNRYHLVWFNQGDKGKGIFYAHSDDAGKTLTTPLNIGEQAAQAAHAHMSEYNGIVDIVWTQFTGTEHQLWHQRSSDNGQTFTPAIVIATAKKGADRPFILTHKNKSYVSWLRFGQGHWLSQL